MFRKNVWLASFASVWFTGGPFASGVTTASAAGTSETVAANDNTRAAGVLSDGALTLRLRAATGLWRPEGADGPALSIDALGEASSSLTVPAPLIRVVEGTPVVVSIHNELGSPLHVNGLCARDGSPCAPLDVPPGETREARFTSGKAGTYHYWATTMGAPVPFRELAGGFIVDPPGRVEPDRVLVITEWSNLTPMQLGRIITADDTGAAFLAADPRFVFVINGLSWPATERMTYRRGERVRWRVINLSSQIAPDAPSRLLFRCRQSGGRIEGLADRFGAHAPRRHPARSLRRDDDDGVDTGARGQLALPLPHHGARLADATVVRS